MKRQLIGLLFFLLLLGMVTQPTGATPTTLTLTVTSLADVIDANPGDGVCETAAGNGVCTLRAAVMEANASPGADTILLPAGIYYLTLPATDYEDAALNGDLDLTDDVTIIGSGEGETIIDGNHTVTNARLFEIFSATVKMSYLTIRNGNNELSIGLSGGILNQYGTLTLTHVTITENKRGGLWNQGGTVELDTVTYTNNVGSADGLHNTDGGSMIVRNSMISGNLNNFGPGGGVWAGPGHLTMINTTVSGNGGGDTTNGGGIFVMNGTATLINSTISGNQALLNGGGIYVAQSNANYPTTLNLYNVTIANNVAGMDQSNSYQGGGIYVSTADGYTPFVNVQNSILANNRLRIINPTANDCYGPINSGGYNLVRTTGGCIINGLTTGNLLGMDPLLGFLADNGGPAWTHDLGGYSPAIDAGNPNGCLDHLGALLPADQRGYQRHADGGSGAARCDMGAYEFNAAPLLYFLYLPLITR